MKYFSTFSGIGGFELGITQAYESIYNANRSQDGGGEEDSQGNQGFPDGWTEGVSDTQRYKCLGNAVTVGVVEAIITALDNTQEDVKG